MIKNNYHTHCGYCKHGYGDIYEYVEEAIKSNFNELGFTAHIPLNPEVLRSPKIYKILLNMPDDVFANLRKRMDINEIDSYLNDIEECRLKYPNIKLLTGFECEYYPENLEFLKDIRKKVDYLTLGVHHYFDEENMYLVFSKTRVGMNDVGQTTNDDIKLYVDTCIEGMGTGLFNVLVHPDLFMIIAGAWSDELEVYARRIIEAAIKNNVYLEINVSDYRKANHKGRKVRYPEYEFWRIASEYKDLKILIGTDAHMPDRVNEPFQKEAYVTIINKLGLKIEEKMEINH